MELGVQELLENAIAQQGGRENFVNCLVQMARSDQIATNIADVRMEQGVTGKCHKLT